MTLQGTDIAVMLTIKTGSAGSSLPQPDPGQSLGKYASTTALSSGTVGALFSTVTAAQASAGYTDYRCVAARNLASVDDMTSAVAFLTDPSGGGTYAVGLDLAGIVAYDSATAQGTEIASSTVAPAGVTFSAPTNLAPLAIGTMAPGKVQLVWIRRTVGADTPGATADTVTLTVRAETI